MRLAYWKLFQLPSGAVNSPYKLFSINQSVVHKLDYGYFLCNCGSVSEFVLYKLCILQHFYTFSLCFMRFLLHSPLLPKCKTFGDSLITVFLFCVIFGIIYSHLSPFIMKHGTISFIQATFVLIYSLLFSYKKVSFHIHFVNYGNSYYLYLTVHSPLTELEQHSMYIPNCKSNVYSDYLNSALFSMPEPPQFL